MPVQAARTCMAKVVSTQVVQFCVDQAVQILGGSEEIMKDLAVRQLGV